MDSILTNNHIFDDPLINTNNNTNNNNNNTNTNNNNPMSRNSSNGLNLSVNDIIPGVSDDLFNEFLDMRLYDKNGQPIQQPGFQHQNSIQQQHTQQQQNLQLQKQLQHAQLQLSQSNNLQKSNNLKFETREFIYDDFLDQEMDTIENGLNDNMFNQNSIQSTTNSQSPNDNFEKLIKFEENVSKELPNINLNLNTNPDINLQDHHHHESEEFKNYDDSRKELMKLRFGNPKKNSIDSNNNTKNSNNNNMDLDNDDSDDDDEDTTNSVTNGGGASSSATTTIRFDSVQKLNKNFEFNEDNNPLNNSSIIPSEYLNDDISTLPYSLKINELPQCSRVETQIKIQLSISPPPPQFLLHIPKDTISKPKLSLNGPIPESIKTHLLYLDSFVVPSSMLDDTDSLVSSPNSPSSNNKSNSNNKNNNNNKLRSCNICKRCMRRELKRASRRKATNSDDSNKWSLDSPKRAVMFNCKEIISFPRPTGNNSSHKDIELLSRIICYCRHHQEPKGFKLLFILKDNNDKVMGRCFSNPIMIMDRKKPTRPSTKNSNNNDNAITNGATDNNNSDFQTNDSNTQTNNDDDDNKNNLKRKSTSQQAQPQPQQEKKESIASTTTTATTTNNEFEEDIFTNADSSNRPLSPSSFYESSSDVLNFSDVNTMPPSSTNPRDNSISISNKNNLLPLRKNSSSVLLNNISSITNASAAASAVSASVAAATAAAGGIQVLPSDLRSKKRQKRSYSPEDSTASTSIANTIPNSNSATVNSRQNSLSLNRKDSLSPTSSDQLSPHNTLNSGASVFSTTPDRNVNYQSSTSVGSSGRVSSLEEQQKRMRHHQHQQQQIHQQQQQQQLQIGGPLFHQMPPQSQQFQPMMPQMMSQQQRLQQQPAQQQQQQMFPQLLSSDFSPMSMPQVPPNGQVPPMLLQQPQSQQQSQCVSPMSIQQQPAQQQRQSVGGGASAASPNQPVIQRIIPAQGPVRGGVEITLLGCNFRPGLSVKFGANVSLATHCWSDSTIVTYLPPASSAGPVLVTFTEDGTNREYLLNSSSNQIFTYTDDTDKQLIELALQIVGLKMNGKLEDAKNIAKRIIGNNNTNGSSGNGETVNSGANSTGTGGGGASTSMDTSISQDNSDYELWLEQASAKIEQLSKSGFNYEQILIKFLSMLQLPNSPISQPNWAICNNEGQTLLHLACLKNYYKLSLFLLHRGSKVNFHDVNNLSPLHYSLINGNRDLFKLLIKYKANLSVKIKNGVTIRDLADSNILDLINEYGNEEDGSLDSHGIKDVNGNGSTVIKSDKGKEAIDDFGRRRLSNDSLSSFASSFDSKGVEESLELDLDLIKPTFKTFNKTGVVKSDFFEDDYSDFADDEQQWGDGNYDCDNDDEYSIGRNDIGELKSIKSLDENSSLYVNDTNNTVAITAVEAEKSVEDDNNNDDDDDDVIASDKLDTLDLEIKKIDSVAKSELENDDSSSVISKSKGKKNMVTFADSDDVENQKGSDGNDADDDRKDQVDDATILAKSTIFDTNKLIGRSLWGKMKKAFRYTPILNKSSLSGLSSNEDNQTDFGEITENNDNATIVDGNESSNESVYLPRDSETRFDGFKRFANHISETFENVGSGDSYDIRSRFINSEQVSQTETPEVQTQHESSVTPQQEQQQQQQQDNNNDDEEENDELPRYEDLFPNGASFRSLMNFGFDMKTPTDVFSGKAISNVTAQEQVEESEVISQLQEQQQQISKNELIMGTSTSLIDGVADAIDNESGEESETSQDDLFFNFFNSSNTKTIKADFRLLFFWLPFMLLLMMVFINKQFNIEFLNFEIINSFYYKFIENIRWIMANFMLGKERVENLLNDAHEAVLTAVSGR